MEHDGPDSRSRRAPSSAAPRSCACSRRPGAGRESAFIPIYGRRRIGKSELILHFLRGKQAVYHVGKIAPAGLQLRELLEEAARALGEPLLAQLAVTDWRAALEAIVSRAKGKVAIVLDEFQWSAGASPELPSVLQELWDRKWKKSGQVVLVLCGSFVGFMEREVLGHKSPLFGRRTAQIHLQPFGLPRRRRCSTRRLVAGRTGRKIVLSSVVAYRST